MDAIFSVFHKDYEVPENELIFPILVGNGKSSIELKTKKEIFKDDTGDHISDLNPFFCELTAQYWIWKNFIQKNDEITGLAHYRRYLHHPLKPNIIRNGMHIFVRKWFHFFYTRNQYFAYLRDKKLHSKNYFLNRRHAIKLLKIYRVILPTPICILENEHITSVKTHYFYNHNKADWDVMEDTLKKMYPDYAQTFDEIASGKYLCVYNMLITTRTVFNDYCQWLFPLLSAIFEKIDIPKDKYQQRVIGFMAERLLNVYFSHTFSGDEICYLPYDFI